jgi:RimJ/RimL family protein N-acetyltransferase
MAEDLRRQGIVQIWAAVAPGNQASLNAFRRAGFRRVASSDITPGRLEAVPTAAATAAEAAVLRALRVSP